jgi:hypothetical protein
MIKSRRLRWVGHMAHGDRRRACRVLVQRPEGRRPLERPGHRWEDNIEINLQEVGWGGMDWIAVAEGRGRWWALVNAVMNLQVP